MRGVSAVIVTLILTMMFLAIAALAYNMFSSSVEDSAMVASEGVDDVKTSAMSRLKIEMISGSNIYIRNTGMEEISQFAVFINGNIADITPPVSLMPDQSDVIVVNEPIIEDDVIRVTASGGAVFSKICC